MIHIYPEELALDSNKLQACYLIFGNDYFLLEESRNKICQIAKQQNFLIKYSYSIDINTNWDAIYYLSQSTNLFAARQIIILTLPDYGPTSDIAEKLLQLTRSLHPDLLLLLCGNKLTKTQENGAWYKEIGDNGIYIHCLTPEKSRLRKWITKKAKDMRLNLSQQAKQLLCYYYEGDILAINHALEFLSLLYSDENLIDFCIKKIANSTVNFTAYHWVDALFVGNFARSWRILQELQKKDFEIMLLLRIIQRELVLLLTLKLQNNNKNLNKIFNQYKIWQSRRQLIYIAVRRLSLHELQLAIQLIAKVDLCVKKDFNQDIWLNLENLSMLLCSKCPLESFINDSMYH